MVDDDDNHFSVEDGILMLTSNISGAGKPEGVTLTAIVEVRDQFSTLNSSYEDLTVRVMITAVIMGCYAHWTRNFGRLGSAYIGVERPGSIGVGDVIARRDTDENGYNHIFLHEVSAIIGDDELNIYFSTLPNLNEHLKKTVPPGDNTGYEELDVNESADCFAEEVAISYLDIHAPLRSVAVTVEYGVPTVEGRAVTVASALLSNNQHQQIFSLDNLELANALNESYTPEVIIDDGKVFIIDDSEEKGDRYEYYANLTSIIDSVQKNSPHEVIVANCPPIYDVDAWQENRTFQISASDIGKVRKYVIIDGTVYPDTDTIHISSESSYILSASGFYGFDSPLADGNYPIKFADHFLCENI